MRVVEPKHFTTTSQGRKLPRKKPVRALAILIMVAVLSGTGFLVKKSFLDKKTETASQVQTLSPSPVAPDVNNQETTEVKEDTKKGTLRQFSANEFRLFYDNLRQPNLEPVENPPSISGNDIADARIRDIAEGRGYRLRSSPPSETTLVSVDGQRLQVAMAEAWRNLKAKASAAGYSMSLVSGYRSVSDQRELFTSRLSATGASIDEVAKGLADEQVNKVLITSSIPGYSKHHTGYTMDLQCAGYGFEDFKNSPCHDWLVADNYKIAKESGFIPSYPDGADLQGPDPEAWEYVYVGTELLYE